MTVKRSQLSTILAEAGLPAAGLPRSLDGAQVTIRTPRAIRAQYGHCPQPVAATIQGQLQGPPPPTTDNSDCVVLSEGPAPAVDAPPDLNVGQLVNIGLELSGMSPVQAQAFRATVDWKATLGLSLPRFIRSSEPAEVAGAPGVLLGVGGRRGPTYELIWMKNGMTHTLVGYGSPGDAVPLASSVAAGDGP